MVKVIYKVEESVGLDGRLNYTRLPLCPVCEEWTYGEDTCPFCRMKGIETILEYGGSRAPETFDRDGKKAESLCGLCGGDR